MSEWKQKAENDLRTAEIVLSGQDPPADTICFHARQCAEKYLKSYLTSKDITVNIRYPGDFIECSIEEAEEAVKMAKAFKDFVLRKLND